MVTHNEQLNLFDAIAHSLDKDITCYAFGGTAMTFYGYKEFTKDVDFLFLTIPDRRAFIDTITQMNFKETSPLKVYIEEKLRDKHRPLMFVHGSVRFDLFVQKIFHTVISHNMEEDIYAVHEFKGKHTLKIRVLRKEHIVMLKSVTERTRDFDDIQLILEKDKEFNWQYLIDEVIWQFQNGDTWVLYDMERTLLELRKKGHFIENKYLDQLYAVANKPNTTNANVRRTSGHE